MAEILALEPHFLGNFWSDLAGVIFFIGFLLFVLVWVSAKKWSKKVTKRMVMVFSCFVFVVLIGQTIVLTDIISKELQVIAFIGERSMKSEPIVGIEPTKKDDVVVKGYVDMKLKNNETITININDIYEVNTVNQASYLSYYEITEEEYKHVVETLELTIDGLTEKGIGLALYLTEEDYQKWGILHDN